MAKSKAVDMIAETPQEQSMEDMLDTINSKESASPQITHVMRSIPNGMVAFSGVDENGKDFEGYQPIAGAKAMKDYIVSKGGAMYIDEKKKK